MKLKANIHKILSIILILSLILPAMPAVKVEAADILEGPEAVSGSAIKGVTAKSLGGAVVTGAEGKQYTLNHEYIKQLNINTGNISINDTSYTQVNGNSEAWDASTDAYVIKGQGASTNTISITSSSTPITVYLVDLIWSGYIEIRGNVNLIIVGDVSVNNEVTTVQVTGANINISGLDGFDTLSCNAIYNTNKIKTGGYTFNQVYIKNIIVNTQNGLGIGGSGNVTIEDSTVNVIGDTDIKDNTVKDINIFNSKASKLNIHFNNNVISNLNIANSKIYDLGLVYQRGSASYFKDKYLNISNSYVNGMTFRLAEGNDGDIRKLDVCLENSHVVNVKSIGAYFGGAKGMYMARFTATNSTFIAPLNKESYALSFTSTVNYINHSSVGNIHGNYNIGGTPVDNNTSDIYLKKIRFRNFVNTYILTTFEDGTVSKLLTDDNGYLYLYVPYGSTKLSFQVTDETGSANYGNYEVEYDSVSGDDTVNSYEPVATKEPTDIATPYTDSEIQYSYDKSNWNNATTDAAGYFKAVIPDDANTIYIKLLDKTKYAVIIDGVVGSFYDEDPIITDQSNCELIFVKGRQGTIYVTATPFTQGNSLNYQWYKNGKILTGKTSPVLNIPMVQDSDAGTYTCIIAEKDGNSIMSNPITVTVESGQLEKEKELAILSQSAGKILIKGYSTELYVNARASLSTRELTFKWYKDGAELIGETQSRVVLNSVDLDDSGSYICRVYEGTAYIDSDPIMVMVENNPLEDDITNLNNLVNDLTRQVRVLTEQLNTANGDKIELQNTIDGLFNQITNYQNQITELQSNIIDLEQELKQANGNNEILILTIQELNNQINLLNQQIVSLQSDLEDANSEKSVLQITIIDLNYEIINLNSQVSLLEEKLSASQEENTQLLIQITDLQNTIFGLENNIADLEKGIEALNDSNRVLQEQLDIAKNSITTLNSFLFLIKSELGVVDDDEIIPAIKQLKAQLLQEEANNILLRQQVKELDKELITARENNSVLVEKLQELVKLVGSKDEDGIKEKINELQVTLLESEVTITKLKKEKNDLLTRLHESENLNKELQQRIDELLILSGEDGAELKKQILDLTSQINMMMESNNNLQNSIKNLNSKISELNAEKSTLESKIVRLETLLDTANSTIGELREQLADLAAGKTILENENTALKKEIERLKQLLANNSSSGGNSNSGSGSNSGGSSNSGSNSEGSSNSGSGISGSESSCVNSSSSKKEKELQNKLDEAFKELENVKNELEDLKKIKDDAAVEKGSDETSSGKTGIKIPENAVIVLPKEEVKEPVIKEYADNLIAQDKIVAQEGWEIAPALEDEWTKEINLIQVIGTSNTENDIIDFNFYARKEEKPEQVYNYSVMAKKPSAIPNFTMEKVIYLGNNFKLNLTNVTENTKVVYKTLDDSIAAVNSKGIITPKKSGRTTIIGTAYKKGVPYRFTIKVTVKDQERVTSNLKEQTIQTASSEPVLVVYKLVYKDSTTKVNINGYADDAVISYISSDSTIATVNQEGMITGIKKGKATITATIVQNNKIYNYILIVRVDDGTADTTVSDYLIL